MENKNRRKILLWLKIKWVNDVEQIIKERKKNWNYKDIFDLVERNNKETTIVDKKTLEPFFYWWVFSDFFWKNYILKNSVEIIKLWLEKKTKEKQIKKNLLKLIFEINKFYSEMDLTKKIFKKINLSKKETKKKKENIELEVSLFSNIEIEKNKKKYENELETNDLFIQYINNLSQNNLIKNKYWKLLKKIQFKFLNKKIEDILVMLFTDELKLLFSTKEFNEIKTRIENKIKMIILILKYLNIYKNFIFYLKNYSSIKFKKDKFKKVFNEFFEINSINDFDYEVSFFIEILKQIWEKEKSIESKKEKLYKRLDKISETQKNVFEIINEIENSLSFKKIDYSEKINNLKKQKETIWFVDSQIVEETVWKMKIKNQLSLRELFIIDSIKNEKKILNIFKEIDEKNNNQKRLNEINKMLKIYDFKMKIINFKILVNYIIKSDLSTKKLKNILFWLFFLLNFNYKNSYFIDVVNKVLKEFIEENKEKLLWLELITDDKNFHEILDEYKNYFNFFWNWYFEKNDVKEIRLNLQKLIDILVYMNKEEFLEKIFDTKYNDNFKNILNLYNLDLDKELILKKIKELFIQLLDNIQNHLQSQIKIEDEFNVKWFLMKEKYFFDNGKLIIWISNWWSYSLKIYLWEPNEKIFNVSWLWYLNLQINQNWIKNINHLYFMPENYFFDIDKLTEFHFENTENFKNNVKTLKLISKILKFKNELNWFNKFPKVEFVNWKEQQINWLYLINIWRNNYLIFESTDNHYQFSDWLSSIKLKKTEIKNFLNILNEIEQENKKNERKKKKEYVSERVWKLIADKEKTYIIWQTELSTLDNSSSLKSINYFDKQLDEKFFDLYFRYFNKSNLKNFYSYFRWLLIYDIETAWEKLMISYFNLIDENWYKVYFYSPADYNYWELNAYIDKINWNILFTISEKNFFADFKYIFNKYKNTYNSLSEYHYILIQRKKKEYLVNLINFLSENKNIFVNEELKNTLNEFVKWYKKIIGFDKLIDKVLNNWYKISWHNIKSFDNRLISLPYVKEKYNEVNVELVKKIYKKLNEESFDTFDVLAEEWKFSLDVLTQLNFDNIKKTLKKHWKETLLDIIFKINNYFLSFKEKQEKVTEFILNMLFDKNKEFKDKLINEKMIIVNIEDLSSELKEKFILSKKTELNFQKLINLLNVNDNEIVKDYLLEIEHIQQYSDKILDFVLYNKNDVLMSTAVLGKMLVDKKINVWKWLLNININEFLIDHQEINIDNVKIK